MDDMLVKSQKASQYEERLEEIFGIIRDKGLMLNPAKCTFRVKPGKFLGYMVTEKGIEVNKAMMETLMGMTPLRNIREIQALNGRIAALSRFISRSAERSIPFFQVLRQKRKFEWTEECQQAFKGTKPHLAELSLLTKPLAGEALYLYIAVGEHSIISVLVKKEGVAQRSVYIVSKELQ